MKKVTLFALFAFTALLSFVTTAMASDVAEVAKKERARREAVQKERKASKVFTNQDIANLKASLGFEASGAPEPNPATGSQITTLPAVDPNLGAGTTSTTSPQEAPRDEESARLREEREALEQQAKDAQHVINQGGGYHTRNIGNQYKAKREAEARIREIDEKLEEKKDENQQ